jgi:N-acylneuraminate cytidylyltransferase
VRHALEILENVTDGYVFSAAPFETPVERSFRLDKNGNLEVLFPEFLQARTQDLKTNYRDAGQFYGAVLSTWERQLPIFNSKSRFIAMQEYETIDIDTPSDWIFAEELFKLRGFS